MLWPRFKSAAEERLAAVEVEAGVMLWPRNKSAVEVSRPVRCLLLRLRRKSSHRRDWSSTCATSRCLTTQRPSSSAQGHAGHRASSQLLRNDLGRCSRLQPRSLTRSQQSESLHLLSRCYYLRQEDAGLLVGPAFRLMQGLREALQSGRFLCQLEHRNIDGSSRFHSHGCAISS